MPATNFDHRLSCNPKNGEPTPFIETVDGKDKIIAYCTTNKMVEELVLRLSRLDAYQYELEAILESKLDGDQIRERIKGDINNPSKISREHNSWS